MNAEMLEKLGYKNLNEMQEKVVSEGLLESPRAVLSAPTASGKTLVALLWMLQQREKGKIVYVVPLKALASEKYKELSEKLCVFEWKIGISVGDFDSSSENLAQFDVIILTSEKLDSILRHKAQWTRNIQCAVFDECHLIGEEGRGATLEVVMTKLHLEGKKILALSATIPNAGEIAQWLQAKLFTSTFRPTKLVIGVASEKAVQFKDDALPLIHVNEKQQLRDVVEKALEFKDKSQVLVFVSTRRSAEATARELGAITSKFLTSEEKTELVKTRQKTLSTLASPTSQCRELANCVENGVAFHHAGITPKQRDLIENGFKQKKNIKAIVCTTTLAMGIDYPATWVVVKDLKRFTGNFSEFIPSLEVTQMLGRSGRPNYDDVGIGVLLATKRDAVEAWDRYVYGKPENLYSKLANQVAMRFHCLSLLSTSYANSFEELFRFFDASFYAFQFGDKEKMYGVIEQIVNELKDFDFVREKNGKLGATPIGRRISELYIDPLTGAKFLEFVKKEGKETIDYLYCLCEATEMRPLTGAKRSEEKLLYEDAYNLLEDFQAWDAEALDKFKTAKILNAWINEASEEQMLKEFDQPPGVLLTRKRNAEWLCYALRELAFMENRTSTYVGAKKLTRRIKHGVKEELLELCRIRGIGRVRARRLYNFGIKNEDDYKNLSKEQIKHIIQRTVLQRSESS